MLGIHVFLSRRECSNAYIQCSINNGKWNAADKHQFLLLENSKYYLQYVKYKLIRFFDNCIL